jgi:hypothetical protein
MSANETRLKIGQSEYMTANIIDSHIERRPIGAWLSDFGALEDDLGAGRSDRFTFFAFESSTSTAGICGRAR